MTTSKASTFDRAEASGRGTNTPARFFHSDARRARPDATTSKQELPVVWKKCAGIVGNIAYVPA